MERTRISTDFCFRGDNYITKKVRVVSLARDMHTVPPVHPDKLLSNYLKQYGSYDLHKVSASREITKIMTVVSLAHDMPTGPPLHSTKYYQNMCKGVKVMECTRIRLQTDGHAPC